MGPSEEKFEVRPTEQDRDFLDKVSKAADASYMEVAKSLNCAARRNIEKTSRAWSAVRQTSYMERG